MQYRIEFLDNENRIVRVMHAEARSNAIALLLVIEKSWPPDAATARAIDRHGRCGPSVSRPQAKSRPQRAPRIYSLLLLGRTKAGDWRLRKFTQKQKALDIAQRPQSWPARMKRGRSELRPHFQRAITASLIEMLVIRRLCPWTAPMRQSISDRGVGGLIQVNGSSVWPLFSRRAASVTAVADRQALGAGAAWAWGRKTTGVSCRAAFR